MRFDVAPPRFAPCLLLAPRKLCARLTLLRLARIHLLGLLESHVVLRDVVDARGGRDEEPVREDAAAGRRLGEV